MVHLAHGRARGAGHRRHPAQRHPAPTSGAAPAWAGMAFSLPPLALSCRGWGWEGSKGVGLGARGVVWKRRDTQRPPTIETRSASMVTGRGVALLKSSWTEKKYREKQTGGAGAVERAAAA